MGARDAGTAAEAQLWSALVKASLGALGLATLATAPLVPQPPEFPALRGYAFAAGGLLVLWAASARHRPLLAILGCIALAAGLAASLAGEGQPLASRAALSLDAGAAVLLGAVARRPWMAAPFLLVPLLVVAAGPPGWDLTHDGLAPAWEKAMGCACPWPGLPAGAALVGAAVGDAVARPWPRVRPSAVVPVFTSAALLGASLVLLTVLPAQWAGLRGAVGALGLVAGLLAAVALAYQAGRQSFVWQAGAGGLLVLVGGLYVDADIRYPQSFDATLAATVLASLLPCFLAALGLLVRHWIGREADAAGAGPSPIPLRDFFEEDGRSPHVETREPLHVGGFGARDRPDEAPAVGGGGGGRAPP